MDTDNLVCGWCQEWLTAELWSGHAHQHLLRLKQMRDEARLTITVKQE